MEAGEFLAHYWQRRPCLIRQAIPGFDSFLTREDLLALSTRDTVESRLVLERGGEAPWQVVPGPLDAESLQQLPDSHWTLLVQNVDLHLPEAAALLRRFRFIPDWRIDDLMISIAPKGGGVGPHLDSYDVFLLQARGRRRWQIHPDGYTEADFIPGLDLRILADFRPQQEWILEPGDMLYLPPGVAHHGVALDDCQTYSIGFRAPTRHELLNLYLDDMLAGYTDRRYADPGLTPQEHSAEITAGARRRIRSLLKAPFENDAALDRWFGRHITRLPDQVEIAPPLPLDQDAFTALSRRARALRCHHACRMVFFPGAGGLLLYVNGGEYPLPGDCLDFVTTLTEARELDREQLGKYTAAPATAQVLHDLYNRGLLHGD
jgi:50S ribosomal protein L16 3-hydroxylase